MADLHQHQGRFVYFSDQREIYNKQKARWLVRQDPVDFPTDAQAIVILVHLIKHPGVGIEQLARQVAKQDKQIGSGAVRRFLEFHDWLRIWTILNIWKSYLMVAIL